MLNVGDNHSGELLLLKNFWFCYTQAQEFCCTCLAQR